MTKIKIYQSEGQHTSGHLNTQWPLVASLQIPLEDFHPKQQRSSRLIVDDEPSKVCLSTIILSQHFNQLFIDRFQMLIIAMVATTTTINGAW